MMKDTDNNQPTTTPEEKQPMRINKKLLVVILLLLVAVSAGYMLAKNSNKPNTTTQNQRTDNNDGDEFKYEAVVSITKDGFMPATITVRPDTRILFENKDDISHQVLPTPGGHVETKFNSGDISAGSGYGHTFTAKGTYNFHDSQYPTNNLVVVVK